MSALRFIAELIGYILLVGGLLAACLALGF